MQRQNTNNDYNSSNNLSVPRPLIHTKNSSVSSTNTSSLHQHLNHNRNSSFNGAPVYSGIGNRSSMQLSSRLSRTNTNTNTQDMQSMMDNESIRTIDKLLTAKPNVTYADKLWTQIDVLDDVKRMSDEVKEKGSFFNEEFNQKLNNLKDLQNKLLEVMSGQHFNSESEQEHRKQLYKLNTVSIGDSTDHYIKSGDEEKEKANNADEEEEVNDAQSKQTESMKQKGRLGGEDHGDIQKMKQRTNKLNEFFDDIACGFDSNILYRKTNFDELNEYAEEIKNSLEKVGDSMKEFDTLRKDLW